MLRASTSASLYKTTVLKKSLLSLYETIVKALVKKLFTLDVDLETEVCFEDFLWANSVFWSRALNIPFPRSYVFPEIQVHDCCIPDSKSFKTSANGSQVKKSDNQTKEMTTNATQGDTVWVEGLVPGIDFFNHAAQSPLQIDQEISVSYGNKGNEELLSLYGFVIDDNIDDYLMVHYPAEAINTVSFSESKIQFLEVQIGPTNQPIMQANSVSINPKVFIGIGTIEDIRVQRDKDFGFVRYSTHDEAALSIQMGNARILFGKPIKR
ncbi:hypothetical protein RIF29_24949 [Crotalaria pallida]|uniref:RRM domain-containing protein n=1 Tax=Crotalaria pallida TaxID=3830 RepID=A0AAN9I0N0_CROPI